MKSKSTSKDKSVKKDRISQQEIPDLTNAIVRSIGAGIYVVQHGRFVYASPKFQELTGYTEKELLSAYSLDHVHPDDREMVREMSIKSLKGGTTRPYEYRYVKKNGDVLWVMEMVSSTAYQGERATLGSFMDITGRKQADEAMNLRAQLLDNATDSIYVHDFEGNFIYVNETACRFHGYSRDEFMKLEVQDIVAPERVSGLKSDWQEILEKGQVILQHTSRLRDGSVISMEIHGRTIELGGRTLILSVGRDTTERMQAEEALRKSEERYRSILDEMDEGYFEIDLAGNFTFVNDSQARLWGYPKEELIGMNYRAYTVKDKAKALYKAYNKVYRTGKPERTIPQELVCKDGTNKFIEISASPLRSKEGEIIGFRGVGRDVTERKKLEEALQLRANLLDNVTDAIYAHDIEGNIIYINETACRFHGYSREEFMKLKIQDIVAPERVSSLKSDFQEIVEKGQVTVESPHRHKDGSLLPVEIHGCTIELGGRTLILTVGRDITERKQAEKALEESEEIYRSLIELSPDMIVVNLEETIAFINSAGAKLLGASSPEQIIGRSAFDFIPPEYHQINKERIQKALETGESIAPMEQKRIRLDGTLVDVEAMAVPIVYQGKPAVQSVVRDISWRKQAEEKLRFLATHDPLTGLPNRTLFTDRMTVALAQAERNRHQMAVIMLDLDRFKYVNDILGHDVGDQLLIEVGNRLTAVLRKSDTVARMGGDEFVILLSQVAQTEYATGVAQKILRAFHAPFVFDSRNLSITTSIGITVYPEDVGSAAELLKNADVAMYRAKERGRDNYQVFSDIPSPT